MKRIVSLFCSVLVMVMCVAVPVSAAEVESQAYLDLLEYSTANNSGTNYFDFKTSTSVQYAIPFQGELDYIDLVVYCSGATPSSVYAGPAGDPFNSLSVTHINGSYYRVYGKIYPQALSVLEIKFNTNSTSHSWYTIFSLKVGLLGSSVTDIDAYCSIRATGIDEQIHFVPTDTINYRIFESTTTVNDTWFDSKVWTTNWKKFDYIDFQLFFGVYNITSITATMGSVNVPIEVSYTDGTTLNGNNYYVTIRMDVSSLDRSSSDYPVINITGRLNTGGDNSVDFINCAGFLALQRDHTLLHYFGLIKTWITDQTSLLQALINNFKSSVNSNFSSLGSWITSQTNSIVDAIRGDTSSGNKFQQDVQKELNELDQAQAVMDSVSKPAVDSLDVSVDRYVSQADISVLAAPMVSLFQGDIIVSVFFMSILLATVSYVLYGKR